MDYETDRINEQIYFWALFKPEYPELFEFWEIVADEYDDLEFGDLMNLSMQMEHLCPRRFHGDPMDVFICRRVWQDKVARDKSPIMIGFLYFCKSANDNFCTKSEGRSW
jgi:hypothetical protein